ncbi:hypothetical protein ACLOJK_002106 [Asimina triloba]
MAGLYAFLKNLRAIWLLRDSLHLYLLCQLLLCQLRRKRKNLHALYLLRGKVLMEVSVDALLDKGVVDDELSKTSGLGDPDVCLFAGVWANGRDVAVKRLFPNNMRRVADSKLNEIHST